MASLKARTCQAAALHRHAAATVAAAGAALDAFRPAAADQRELHDLAQRLRAAASLLAPGWLGSPLDAQSQDTPLGGARLPAFVRIGTAQPLDDARFPVIVPLLGTGHLTVDADARDSRVAGLLRAILLRLLAAAPPGSLLVRAVDAAGSGTVFTPFAPLADAGLLPPPATDRTGLRAVLAEAEQWVRPARPATARHNRRDRTLLVVIASMPESVEATDLARIAGIAAQGPDSGLHLVVAGWPPPPLAAETTQPPLPRATMITVRNPYALVGDPPGASFGDPPPHLPSTGLNAPVFFDADPPTHLFNRVCQELAARFDADSCLRLVDLLPDKVDGLWSECASDGLVTTVGYDGNRPVTLQLNELTPHWMIGGRAGAGKNAFLTNILYGFCTRYGPEELAVYLLDFKEGMSFAEFVPTEDDQSWLPHARVIGVESDREYGLAVLRDLNTELTRRSTICQETKVTGFSDLPQHLRMPRLLCVIDEFPALIAGDDRLATEATALLDSLARKGRSYGIHLILVSRAMLGAEAHHPELDSVFGQFPVRVALPGGGAVLEPTNDAAAGLPSGTAVVNTASGLGGPRGATRGHERTVRFPDPQADRAALIALRHRLWAARPADSGRPHIFAGYAHQRLAEDPVYQAALSRTSSRPAALLGRTVDVPLSTAAFPLDTSPGRHLAVLGSSGTGADLLDSAARSLAIHHAARTVRFIIASLTTDADEVADALAADLASRQEVETVDLEGLLKAIDTDRPGYLVVFGMERVGVADLQPDRLRGLLHDGPRRGLHLLSWWRELHRFSAQVGAGAARDDVAGLVFLDVPGAEVSLLLGQPVEWHPRPGRALVYDRHSDHHAVIVPFVRAAHHEVTP